MTDTLGSLNDCYAGQVLYNSDTELLGAPAETYECFGEVK